MAVAGAMTCKISFILRHMKIPYSPIEMPQVDSSRCNLVQALIEDRQLSTNMDTDKKKKKDLAKKTITM